MKNRLTQGKQKKHVTSSKKTQYRLEKQYPQLTERQWHSGSYSSLKTLLLSQLPVELQFTKVLWFDLWPIVDLSKFLLIRKQRGFRTPLIHLPSPATKLNAVENKSLNFLVDIGFVALARRCGARFAIGNRRIELDEAKEEPSGLSAESLNRLEQFGYNFKEYKGKILLPITEISTEEDVENLRTRLWSFVSNSLRHFQSTIDYGTFVDTFFRELTENAIEHSKLDDQLSSTTLVAARLIRSVSDLEKEKQNPTIENRARGRGTALANFLRAQQDSGYLELVVADRGPGIHGTLSREGNSNIYFSALQPETSRLTREERLEKGRSPLTGLGSCAYCLEDLPALLVYRERQGSMAIQKAESTDPGGHLLGFERVTDESPDHLIGCNVQLILAFSQPALQGREIEFRSDSLEVEVEPTVLYIRPQVASAGKATFEVDRGRGHQNRDYQLVLLDVTDLSAVKDIAWAALMLAIRLRADHHLPVILVGTTPTFTSRILEHLRTLPETQSPFSSISNTIRMFEISITPPDELRAYTSKYSAANNPKRLGSSTYSRSRLHEYSAIGAIKAWQREIGIWLRALIKRSYSYLWLEGTSVRLPNGKLVSNYLDIFKLLRTPRLRRIILDSLKHYVYFLKPKIVITYSAVSRQIASELLRDEFPEIKQVDFPDPYSPGEQVPGLRTIGSRRVMAIADAIHTGGHLSRILETCLTVGVEIETVVCLLDSRSSEGRMVNLSPRQTQRAVFAILRLELSEIQTPIVGDPKLIVDPYSLSLKSAQDRTEIDIRTKGDGLSFYNTIHNLKAILSGHFVHRSGRHFSHAIDFYQFAKPNFRNRIVEPLVQFARGCKAIVTTEESVVSTIDKLLAGKIGLDETKVISAVAVTSPNRHYEFSANDFDTLCKMAKSKEPVLLVEDAISSANVFSSTLRALSETGIEQVKVAVLLNNTSPDFIWPRRFGTPNREIEVELFYLFRSFFPAFGSSADCPYCKEMGELREASQICPNSLIATYLRSRCQSLEAVDVKSVFVDPSRCRKIPDHELPLGPQGLGIPAVVRSIEAAEIAFRELSNSDEGLLGLYKYLSEGKEHPELLSALALTLSQNIPTLQRLGVANSFAVILVEAVAKNSGETATPILESLLLWPLEFLSLQLHAFLTVDNPMLWSSDSSFATIFALINRVQREATADISSKIISRLREVVKNEPEKSKKLGVLNSLYGMVAMPTGSADSVRWAWRQLISRLSFHRKAHHQILQEIGAIASYDEAIFDKIVGLSTRDESLRYFDLMLCLADIERAVRVLQSHRQLPSDQSIDRLLSAIRSLVKARSEARTELVDGSSVASFEVRRGLLESIVSSLKTVQECLRLESDEDNLHAVSLKVLIDQKVLSLPNSFLIPLAERLRQRFTVGVDETSHVEKAFIMCDPLLLRKIIDSVFQNVNDHSRRGTQDELFRHITLRYGVDQSSNQAYVDVLNECRDQNSTQRFMLGEDYSNFNSELSRYGGSYTGSLTGSKFRTRIQFELA